MFDVEPQQNITKKESCEYFVERTVFPTLTLLRIDDLMQGRRNFVANLDDKVHGANVGQPGADRPQVGPMLATWKLLSGNALKLRLFGISPLITYIWHILVYFTDRDSENHMNENVIGE